MVFTYEQLIRHENPYAALSNADSLNENAAVLNALSKDEKIALATKIISECPADKFCNYGRQIEALRHPLNPVGGFYHVLNQAHQVRHMITALMDQRNKKPYLLFVSEEFNHDLFNQFSTLANHVLEGNQTAIAERLALFTPEKYRSTLSFNIKFTFSNKELSTNLQCAMTLVRNIERYLLGEQPESFFSSRDFDHDTCTKFEQTLSVKLKGHEEQIGAKLAAIGSAETRKKILHKIDLLHAQAFDQTNPFKLIADAMRAKEPAPVKRSLSQSNHLQTFFNDHTSEDDDSSLSESAENMIEP